MHLVDHSVDIEKGHLARSGLIKPVVLAIRLDKFYWWKQTFDMKKVLVKSAVEEI